MRCNLCQTPVETGQEPRWRKHGFEIFRCSCCGLLFRGQLPTPEELLAIYDRSYFVRQQDGDAQGYADYLSDEPEHRLTARLRVRELGRVSEGLRSQEGGQAHRSPDGVRTARLLDVGSAAGFFMDEARAAGWEVSGI